MKAITSNAALAMAFASVSANELLGGSVVSLNFTILSHWPLSLHLSKLSKLSRGFRLLFFSRPDSRRWGVTSIAIILFLRRPMPIALAPSSSLTSSRGRSGGFPLKIQRIFLASLRPSNISCAWQIMTGILMPVQFVSKKFQHLMRPVALIWALIAQLSRIVKRLIALGAPMMHISINLLSAL